MEYELRWLFDSKVDFIQILCLYKIVVGKTFLLPRKMSNFKITFSWHVIY